MDTNFGRFKMLALRTMAGDELKYGLIFKVSSMMFRTCGFVLQKSEKFRILGLLKLHFVASLSKCFALVLCLVLRFVDQLANRYRCNSFIVDLRYKFTVRNIMKYLY